MSPPTSNYPSILPSLPVICHKKFWNKALRVRSPVSPDHSRTLIVPRPIESLFGWMLPRGPDRLALSQMNMAGMGAAMIKGIVKKKNAASLPELMESAQKASVRLVACTMTMDLLGIKREELIEGVEVGGVATYLDRAQSGKVNLFI